MNFSNNKMLWLKKTLGPGILFASTAIGVSHLVQSTRAGANYGFGLIIFITIANLFKYPFFEFASRYSNVKNISIIEGYKNISNWALWSYLTITIISMFFITSAVGAVTAGFLQNLFNTSSLKIFNHIILFSICGLILIFGQYRSLDGLIKIVGLALLITTLLSFGLVLFKGPIESNLFPKISYNESNILFIIALMGWMPTAVDLSSWNSLWTLERMKLSKYKPKLSETIFEFNLGYISSAVLSICFMTLGAYLMYGSGSNFSNNSALFASQVIQLYTASIGSWSYYIIAISSFSIMFGTCIAVFDGYARSVSESIRLVQERESESGFNYNITIGLLIIGSIFIIYLFSSKLKQLVDLATTISFLIAPLIAIANYILVTKDFDKNFQPKMWLKILAFSGILYLFSFCLIFLYFKLF